MGSQRIPHNQSEGAGGQRLETDQEASESYELANAILIECKRAIQLSDLERAVSILRNTLTNHPESHPRRSDSLNNLAEALVVRFSHSGQPQDLGEAIILRREAFQLGGLGTIPNESQLPVRLLLN